MVEYGLKKNLNAFIVNLHLPNQGGKLSKRVFLLLLSFSVLVANSKKILNAVANPAHYIDMIVVCSTGKIYVPGIF